MCLHARWLPLVASTLLLHAACDDRANAPSPVPGSTPPALAITSISPSEGLVNQRVTVRGSGFAVGATLTVDGLPATFVAVDSLFVMGSFPPHPAGPVDVVVTNPDGRSATRTGGFTYGSVSLTVSAATVRPGEPISVNWTAPGGRKTTTDWIGLFAGVQNDSFISDASWHYVGSEAGSLTFTAPGDAGDYEVRYLPNDGYDDVARVAVAVR